MRAVAAAERGMAIAVWMGLAMLSLVVAQRPARADTFDILSKETDTPSLTVWRIEVPNVKKKQTDYPSIIFAPGDRVSVDAGGCVQTGGIGKTWKRYVNPSGPNSDHLYHGLISIPGVTNGLVRLQNYGLDTVRSVPAGGAAHLVLGYEDDGYGDNGYGSHDDGTQDQCKNSVDAFVIVSIGHGGATPPLASTFENIGPNQFRCEAGWAFHNFNTPRLSWSSFKDAFDFQVWDYLDPATYIVFLATRDSLASGGNCMGMSFLADVGEDQFIVDDLHEAFWNNYKNMQVQTPKVVKDINTAHWGQLSVAFLHAYLANVAKSPGENADLIEHDLTKQNFNYGMISIAHGTDGHVLVPLKVRRSGNEALIDVYDSNRPCGSVPDDATYPSIVVKGDQWSYVMADGTTWSGSTLNDGLAYVPYAGSGGWRAFAGNFTGIVEVIFGANTQVNQVTDGSGRKLYVDGTAKKVDASAAGLGKSLFRLPALHQAPENQPQHSGSKYTTVSTTQEPPAFAQTAANLDADYAADYANGQVYVSADTSLSNLSFDVSVADGSRPVRALVHQGNEFFELRLLLQPGSRATAIVVHRPASLVEQGVTIRSVDGKPIAAAIAMGSNNQGNIRIQQAAEVKTSGSLHAAATQSSLALSSAEALAPTTVTERVLSPVGVQPKVPRPLPVLRDTAVLH